MAFLAFVDSLPDLFDLIRIREEFLLFSSISRKLYVFVFLWLEFIQSWRFLLNNYKH
jgi:hypothetical protein